MHAILQTACRPTWFGALLIGMVIAIGTTSGCWKSTANKTKSELEKLKEKKPEPPFETLRAFTEPNERSSIDEKAKDTQRIMLASKPGHWAGVLVQTRSNLADFDGVLNSTPQDSQQRPVDLERSPFWLTTTRGVTLPKGQRKSFETLFFTPRPAQNALAKGSTWMANRLHSRSGGSDIERVPEMISHMPSYQYFLVVLAAQPAKYTYLNDLPSVRPPMEFMPVNVLDANFYRVLFPPVDQPLALPTESLCWTTTAYLLWDDVLATALSPEQQRSLVDWLHWGGGLIVSGPDSLDKLQNSFLADYLPATGGTAGPIEPKQLAELHRYWSISGDHSKPLGARAAAAWSGIELGLKPEAEFVPETSQLVAQRRVGRGRIVVTSFRLSEAELVSWPSFDSFFNAVLLGRPARKFQDRSRGFEFVGHRDPLDSRLITGLRYLTRDETEPSESEELAANEAGVDLNGIPFGRDQFGMPLDVVDTLKAEPGTAAWNDFSWISSTARQTLQAAAGISVPRRQFVLKMIGLYLLVIVPINWIFFRLIGRVEWAWIAVPVVAVVWGVLVVWLAQLDIGFARAQIEVDVVEIQPNYSRGHLTRYLALYSSLSNDYELRFDNRGTLALPFSTDRQRLSGQSSSEVLLTSVGQRDLSEYPVASNSTGMIHAEQMLDLGGEVTWLIDSDGRPHVRNDTKFELKGASLVRRADPPAGNRVDQVAWLGDLAPGEEAEVEFYRSKKVVDDKRDAAELTTNEPAEGSLNLRKLIDAMQDARVLEPGEVRLVAWHDDAVQGVQVNPSSAQSRSATVIVAHLTYGTLPEHSPDKNLRPLSPFRLNAF